MTTDLREQRVCNVLVKKYHFMCWIEHPGYICFPLANGGAINVGTANAKWELDVEQPDGTIEQSHDFNIPDNTSLDDIQIADRVFEVVNAWNIFNPTKRTTRNGL